MQSLGNMRLSAGLKEDKGRYSMVGVHITKIPPSSVFLMDGKGEECDAELKKRYSHSEAL